MSTVSFAMTDKYASDALEKYLYLNDFKPGTMKVYRSALSTAKKLGLIEKILNPDDVFDILDTAMHGNPPKDYSPTGKTNVTKVLSAIAKATPDKDKVKFMKQYLKDKGKLKQLAVASKKQLIEEFDFNVKRQYAFFNGGTNIEENLKRSTQKMNAEKTANYQEHHVLVDKVLQAMSLFEEDELTVANRIYVYQFLVAALIFLLADRSRRLDIYDTVFEGPGNILREDGILIKEANKTQEIDVLLPFTDPRLKSAVQKLVDARKKRNYNRLFLKLNGDEGTLKWWKEAFKTQMKSLGIGQGLFMGMFRLAYGIKLSKQHDGSLISEQKIEDAMGHSWHVHQLFYNLTKLENGEIDIEKDETEQVKDMEVVVT